MTAVAMAPLNECGCRLVPMKAAGKRSRARDDLAGRREACRFPALPLPVTRQGQPTYANAGVPDSGVGPERYSGRLASVSPCPFCSPAWLRRLFLGIMRVMAVAFAAAARNLAAAAWDQEDAAT
jgi:hypothetical protein